jgi:hypothetical protein
VKRETKKAKVDIEAGVCGLHTTASAASEDDQNVAFDVDTDCDKIRQLGPALRDKGLIDAYQEISPAGESVVMQTVRSTLKGCCAGFAVPVGLFKAMQVAAVATAASAHSAAARVSLWATANHSTTARTFRNPRTRNRCSPRFRAIAFTHSAVDARSLQISFASGVPIRTRHSAIVSLSPRSG